jgi:hypothetical protein
MIRRADKNTLPLDASITPEMVSAGAREVRDWDDRFETPAELAKRVFIAMLKASPISNLQPSPGDRREGFLMSSQSWSIYLMPGV